MKLYKLEHEEQGIWYFTNTNKAAKYIGTSKSNVDMALKDVEIDNIKSLIIPGGDIKTICNEEVYELIRDLVKKEIIVAAICAGVDVLENAGVLKDTKSTHSEDTDIYNDKKVITARANAYVDFAIEVAKELNLFKDEVDLKESIDFWKFHKRVQ